MHAADIAFEAASRFQFVYVFDYFETQALKVTELELNSWKLVMESDSSQWETETESSDLETDCESTEIQSKRCKVRVRIRKNRPRSHY